MNGYKFAQVAMTSVLMAEATSADDTTAQGGVKPAKKSGFAALLQSMNSAKTGGKAIAGAKGKDVVTASQSMLLAEIPELSGGLWTVGENGEKLPKVASNTNRPSVIWTSRLPINKGNVYVSRCGVLITPAIAKLVIEQFGKHNRNQTKPAIKRYADDMSAGNWPYVGNTFGFVVAKKGDLNPLGQCNGGHTCKGIIESGVSAEVDIYFGVPECHADKADVNIARTGKDIIGRLHRYDKYDGLSEIDGQPIGLTLKADDCKVMSDTHSQAIRMTACILSYKPVKDSEPLGASAIAALDAHYGDCLEKCILDCYLLDKSALWENDKGNKVAGGLKRLMSLSHAATLMLIASTNGDVVRDEKTGVVKTVKNLSLDEEVQVTIAQFFAEMVDYENQTDESNPAVSLRQTLQRFKNNSVTNQNFRWIAEKYAAVAYCMLALKQSGIPGTEDIQIPDCDVETLVQISVKGTDLKAYASYFESALDKAAPEKPAESTTEATTSTVSEIDDDEEEMPAVAK